MRRRPAERLHALFELARRLPQSPRRARSKVSTPDRIVALLGPRLVQLDHEEAWVLHVDPHLRLIGAPLRLSSGGAAGTDVPVARVPAEALRRSAT